MSEVATETFSKWEITVSSSEPPGFTLSVTGMVFDDRGCPFALSAIDAMTDGLRRAGMMCKVELTSSTQRTYKS